MWTVIHGNSRILCSLRIFLLNPYFVGYCLAWLFVRYSRLSGHPIPYINNWLTDFVFVPLIAHFAFCAGIFILDLKKGFSFPLCQLLALSFMTSIFFEYLSPRITDYNTADIVDVVCYFSGALFYYFIHQPFNNKKLAHEERRLPASASSTSS